MKKEKTDSLKKNRKIALFGVLCAEAFKHHNNVRRFVVRLFVRSFNNAFQGAHGAFDARCNGGVFKSFGRRFKPCCYDASF